MKKGLDWLFIASVLVALFVLGLLVAPVVLSPKPAESVEPAKVIGDLAVWMLSYAAVLAAAGTVSMAVLELLKGVLDARRRFQEYRLDAWLGKDCESVRPELLYLAIGDVRHEDALCGQELEKMMGQLQAAARLALDFPDRFPLLYNFLTSTDIAEGSTYTDVKHARVSTGDEKSAKDRQLWFSHASTVRQRIAGSSTEIGPTERAESSDAAQARARLASLVARKLDGFQLRTQFLWDRWNQAVSLAIGIIIVWYALSGLNMPWYEQLLLGIIGGLLAPFAKDFSKTLAAFASK